MTNAQAQMTRAAAALLVCAARIAAGETYQYWNASAPSPPLAYGSPERVVALLAAAGLTGDASANESSVHRSGIPADDTALRNQLGPEGVARLQRLAQSVTPALPWASLAFFHRRQYAKSNRDYLGEHNGAPAEKRLAAQEASRRARFVRDFGGATLSRNATVLDAGCGSGRNGLFFIDHLDRGKYYGFDVDAFSLRSFIQLELGVIYPGLLAEKDPNIRLVDRWRLEEVLGGALADVVLFASVLKKRGLGEDLRRAVLAEVKKVLAPGGRVFVFADCDAALRATATNLSLAVLYKHHHGDCVFDDPDRRLGPSIRAPSGACLRDSPPAYCNLTTSPRPAARLL